MPQSFLVYVPLDCDTCNMAGILDQLQVESVGIPHFAIKDGESAEDLALPREQGARPNGANTIRQHPVTIVVPGRLLENVGNIDRLPAIDCSTARCAVRTNQGAPHVRGKSA